MIPPAWRRCALLVFAIAAPACGGADPEPVDRRVAQAATEAPGVDGAPPSRLPCIRAVTAGEACGPEGSHCIDVRACGAPTYACVGGTWTVDSKGESVGVLPAPRPIASADACDRGD